MSDASDSETLRGPEPGNIPANRPLPATDTDESTLPPSNFDPDKTLLQSDISRLPQSTRKMSLPGYEVLGELGRGGMGVVYRARQIRANRDVALKMILSGEHAGAAEVARFWDEAEAVARLQHPNIVAVFDLGEHDSRPFFSMEFCPGGSLAQLAGGKPFPSVRAGAELVLRAFGKNGQIGTL